MSGSAHVVARRSLCVTVFAVVIFSVIGLMACLSPQAFALEDGAQVECIANPTENGEYTLSYSVTIEGSADESMVQDMFDPKAKLTVADDAMRVTMLCSATGVMSESLLDFTLGLGEAFDDSEMNLVKIGETEYKEYVIEVADISQPLKVAALVSAMGGVPADKGKYTGDDSTYTKADIVFTGIETGWVGYDTAIGRDADAEQRVVNALISEGYDTDNDGQISAEEWAKIDGEVYLGHYDLTDISLLRNLGPKVTELSLVGNAISEVPVDLFENMTGLEALTLSNNKIKVIARGAFAPCARTLYSIDLENNQLGVVNSGVFSGLPVLSNLDLSDNGITEISANAFEGDIALDGIGLSNNELTTLPKGLFVPCANSLTFLGLEQNPLGQIPQAVEECKALKSLFAYLCGISDISNIDFSKFPALDTVNLRNNDIEFLPAGVFAQNTQLNSVDLYDNFIPEVTADMIPVRSDGEKVHKFDLMMNDIVVVDPAVKMRYKAFNRSAPQKSVASFQLSAAGDGGLSWSQALGLLDFEIFLLMTRDDQSSYNWIETAGDYLSAFADKYGNATAKEVVDRWGVEYSIATELQKQASDGVWEVVSNDTSRGVDDVLSGSYTGLVPGTYRVVKTYYSTNFISDEQVRDIQLRSNEVKIDAKAGSETKGDLAQAEIAEIATVTYSGKEQTPALKVTLDGKTLNAGTDYTVSYMNNKNAGVASVTVKGEGSYTGSKSASFTIAKAKNTLSAKAKNVKARAKRNTVIAKAKAFVVKKAQGKITFEKVSGNKKVTVAPNGKVTVKKGLKKGNHKVKVKVSAAGNANYEKLATAVTLKVQVS